MKLFLYIFCFNGFLFVKPEKIDDFVYKDISVKPLISLESNGENRIIGGEIAEPHSIPYQVFFFTYLKDGKGSICGGSLISKNYILTAAHCVENGISYKVILGATNIKENEPNQQIILCTKAIIHSDYKREEILNDIALIQLSRSANITDYVQIIDLPKYSQMNDSFEGEIIKVSGWGVMNRIIKQTSDNLRYVKSTIISNDECKKYFSMFQNYQLCMSGNRSRGGCFGDSGGPGVTNGIQVGIVSYVARNCNVKYPTAFTRITSFLNWIEENSDVNIKDL